MFEKLSQYIGTNSLALLQGDEAQQYVFRVIKNRVYYMQKQLESMANNIPSDKLSGAGILIGKITHNQNFHINITALPILAQYCTYKVVISKSAEQSFLYGNHIMRSQVIKISDGIPENTGVVIFSEDDAPLGFGIMTKSGIDTMRSQFQAIVVIHQADIGEYLRDQDTLF